MRAFAAALFLTLCAFVANAQLVPSALTGRVTVGGAPAAGVTVTATSRARQQTRTATTGAQGTYWIDAIEPGEYDVSFSRSGLSTLSRPATVQHARIARADAQLDESDDEENVTATAHTPSVAEWTSMTTHFTREELERLPLLTHEAERIAPGAFRGSVTLLDGSPMFGPQLLGNEVVDELTIFRGNQPVESDFLRLQYVDGRTRSGADDFFLVLRDNISSERWWSDELSFDRDRSIDHFFESASSGRIGKAPLWFFAAGWSGDAADRFLEDLHGLEVKVTSQLGAAHQLTAIHLDSESEMSPYEPRAAASSLRYDGVLGERFIVDALASRSRSAAYEQSFRYTQFATRASYVLPTSSGDHVLSAGATRTPFFDYWVFFLGDRWSAGRWFVDGGVRYDGDASRGEVTPRVAVTFDLRGNGRHALIASYGQYAFTTQEGSSDLLTLGYAIALGTSGSVRADVLRSKWSPGTADQFQLDARYRLFDRLDLGANYTWFDGTTDFGGLVPARHDAHAWAGIEVPIGEHAFGATLLQHWSERRERWETPTDLALRYSLPVRRTTFTIAADVVNVLDAETASEGGHRTARLWLRLRV